MASIRGDKKYIYHYGTQPDQFFDLSKDPHEENNIADEISDKKLRQRRDELLAWEAKVDATYERQQAEQEAREETILETTAEETTAAQ